jgi:hypothetical protein
MRNLFAMTQDAKLLLGCGVLKVSIKFQLLLIGSKVKREFEHSLILYS